MSRNGAETANGGDQNLPKTLIVALADPLGT
jgi:hypothetical protein